jgi:hypothetical protein
MNDQFLYVKSLIFDGHVDCKIKVNDCLISLAISNINVRQFEYNNNTELLVEVISNAIFAINNKKLKREEIKSVIFGFSFSLVLKIYEAYIELYNKIQADVEKYFENFLKINDSKIRWELFKHGYKFLEPLNKWQEMWVFCNVQAEKRDHFDQMLNFSDYIINHITHATINPKSYVNSTKNKRSENKELEQKKAVDLNKSIFDELKVKEDETFKEAEERSQEFLEKKLNTDDEHDIAIKTIELEHLKRLLRNRKKNKYLKTKAKPTVILGQKGIKVGMKQSFTLDDSSIVDDEQSRKYLHNNVNYLDIMSEKAFFNILNKDDIFKEIMAEEMIIEEITEKQDQEEKIKEEDQKKEKNHSNQPRTTIRDLLQKKGLDIKDMKQISLKELSNGRG